MNNYQNVIVDGKTYGKRERSTSRFFNEGKWHNFIEPLLPKDCSEMTFIDFGCNYGIFLKMAKERGFENVLGVESNKTVCDVAEKYLGPNSNIICTQVDGDIVRNNFICDLPATDYILLANFHYHVYTSVLIHFLNLMRRKTRYAIVVSVEDARSKLYSAKSDIASVRRYFRLWDEVQLINNVPEEGDLTPRKMYSILFKTEIDRIPISDVTSKFGKYSARFYTKVLEAAQSGREVTPMTHPILLRDNNSVIDGHHRLATLETQKKMTVLVEKL